jgi:WD40-like Beta Propeller Repeat
VSAAWISRRLLSALLATAASCALMAPLARAGFGPIELLSKTAREQADYALEPAISANGRFVAFCGQIGGREGVFREQLETGQLTPVAVRAARSGGCGTELSYASSPSISADGRYVSFTTRASLDAANDLQAESSDVYVADMASSPPAFELASAGNGSPSALAGGSLAAGRVALSADGRRLAFVNQGEVYVRDLGTGETTLISARRDPLTDQMTSEPAPGGGAFEPAGAAISADGSTVAWVGEHLPEQVPLLDDEETAIRAIEAQPAPDRRNQYHEPLWRRVPAIPGEDPIRRVVGGGDPLALACPPSGTLADPACQGPYPAVATKTRRISNNEEDTGLGWGIRLPQLSADGDTVAVIGNPGEQYDLFAVDMDPGLDRREAVRQLTRWTNPLPGTTEPNSIFGLQEFWPLTGAVEECAISPDGSRIAFTTIRQSFPLAPPTLITARPAAVSQLQELYQVDLAGGTIERATPGSGADVSLGAQHEGATSPSYGAGDRLLAFSSTAYNLMPGDANEAGDVFLVESPPPAPVGSSALSSRPAALSTQPSWRLSASAFSLPDGRVRVVAVVPGGGTLRARAKAQSGSRLKSRRVASGQRRAQSSTVVTIELKLPRRLRSLARQRGGLVTSISVTFTGQGGQPLHALLGSRFHVHRKQGGADRKGAGR